MCAKFHDLGLSRGSKPNGGGKGNGGPRPKRDGFKPNNGGNRGSFSANTSVPSAPYNFVRLNDRIVEPPLAAKLKEKSYADFIKEDGKYSGYFDIEIQNDTPMYIAGADGFFSNGSRLCIPGSSLRGCLKNTFKVITNSAFRGGRDNPDLTDKHLYFRAFASPCKSFSKLYNDTLVRVVGFKETETKATPGFLVREGKKYYICPAQYDKADGTHEERPAKALVWNNTYVEVHTGPMRNKKHFYKIHSPKWNEKYEISSDIIADYQDDKNRKGANVLDSRSDGHKLLKGTSLGKGAEAYDHIAPCFFIAEGRNVRHFGAGPFYRISYRKTIGEHIPKNINTNDVDFADAVFGRKEDWSSRIFFDDLYLIGNPNMDVNAYPKILATPNPTSFQFYLEPTDKGEASHWDGVTDIRGYKMYWHRRMDWRETDASKQNTNMTEKFMPVKAGNIFRGRIRFENLDAIELGAVCALFALGSEKGIAYKLGMGKPIGMGTIRLAAQLHLQSEDYYQKLFDEKGFATCDKLEAFDKYTDAFKKYMMDALKSMGSTSLELYEARMRELRIIMDTNVMQKPDWVEKTRYMDISRDRRTLNDRIPLPHIEDVVK